MNDAARETLRELIARHGPGLLSDARRCEALLRDFAGAHRREINILTGALEERVPLDLLAARSTVPRELLLTRLARRLEDNLALTEEAARWAVESWALALGIVTDADLAERQKRHTEEPPQIPTPPTQTKPPTPAPAPRPPAPTPPPATPPPPPPAPPPRKTAAPPPVQRRQTRAAPPQPRPPAPLPPPPKPVRHSPPPPARAATQTPPAGPFQAPATEPRPRRGRWRGCLVGCLLLAALAALLVFGAPFVVNVLLEEQQQRNVQNP